jgi:hypothetical protein
LAFNPTPEISVGKKTGVDAATVTSHFLENVASQGLSSMRVALPLVGVKVPRMR